MCMCLFGNEFRVSDYCSFCVVLKSVCRVTTDSLFSSSLNPTLRKRSRDKFRDIGMQPTTEPGFPHMSGKCDTRGTSPLVVKWQDASGVFVVAIPLLPVISCSTKW